MYFKAVSTYIYFLKALNTNRFYLRCNKLKVEIPVYNYIPCSKVLIPVITMTSHSKSDVEHSGSYNELSWRILGIWNGVSNFFVIVYNLHAFNETAATIAVSTISIKYAKILAATLIIKPTHIVTTSKAVNNKGRNAILVEEV
jgi:hypothetical protein